MSSSETIITARPSLRRFWPGLELALGLFLTVGIFSAIIIANVFFADAADQMDLAARLTPPFINPAHIFGTDPLGRDVLMRALIGGKVSLIVGFASVAGSATIGTIMGLIAGYYRGFWDTLVMRYADVQLAMPFILLAITFVAILGGSMTIMILLMIAAQWVRFARLVRGQVLALREREFILSAQATGVSDFNILLRHLLPNLLGPVIVLATLDVANNILLESSLTFLGLGANPLIPSWGGMLADGRGYIQTAWWVTVFPGLLILLTVLGLNLLGDWLRDRLDPMGRTT